MSDDLKKHLGVHTGRKEAAKPVKAIGIKPVPETPAELKTTYR